MFVCYSVPYFQYSSQYYAQAKRSGHLFVAKREKAVICGDKTGQIIRWNARQPIHFWASDRASCRALHEDFGDQWRERPSLAEPSMRR